VVTQGLEVGVIADSRQNGHYDPQSTAFEVPRSRLIASSASEIQAMQIRQARQNTGLPVCCSSQRSPESNSLRSPRKRLMTKAGNARLLTGAQQRDGPDEVGKYPTPLDIGDQNHGNSPTASAKPMFAMSAFPEIDLGWRSGPFASQSPHVRGQPRMRSEQPLRGQCLVQVVLAACMLPTACPWTMTCATESLLGFSRMGSYGKFGAIAAACACSACARPISAAVSRHRRCLSGHVLVV